MIDCNCITWLLQEFLADHLLCNFLCTTNLLVSINSSYYVQAFAFDTIDSLLLVKHAVMSKMTEILILRYDCALALEVLPLSLKVLAIRKVQRPAKVAMAN